MTLGELLDKDRNSFALVRLVAALAVIIDHCFELVLGNVDGLAFSGTTTLTLGQHAVNLFFVLSGILVASSLDRSRTLVHYLVSRALRILPGLMACVLVTAIVIGPVFSNLGSLSYFTSGEVYAYIAKTMTLMTGSAPLPGVFAGNPVAGQINIPLWTIKYEVVCYLLLGLLPFVGLWRSNTGKLMAAGSMIAVYAVAMALPGVVEPWSSLHWFLNLSLAFSIGVTAYVLRDKLVISFWAVLALALAFAALQGTAFERALTPVVMGYAMLWIAQFRFAGLREWTNKTDLSFGIYVYGWVVQQCVVATFPGLGVWPVAAFVLGLLIPIAWVSWVLIEKTGLQLKNPIFRWLDTNMDNTDGSPAPASIRNRAFCRAKR